ncbi:MAG: helix-turn-helix domain-containing protein [Christensenellales bacterium]
MNIGERIQQLRKASGLSQEQLAEMIGVSRQAISKWETDQSSPELEKVLALSKVFSISTDELLGKDVVNRVGISTPQLYEVVARNMKKRQFTFGWITVVVGLVLLIMEYFSLRMIQLNAMRLDLQYAAGTGFFSDPMQYAQIEPMPTIFTITFTVIILGIGLTAFSFFPMRKKISQ